MRTSELVGVSLLVAHLVRSLARGRPKLAVTDRLAMLPRVGVEITAPIVIRWDTHQIPFIEAKTDDDLAVALGIVHAHLRLGQLEMMRRLSQGRVAEAIGPLGIEVDRLIRTIDIGRAIPGIVALLPDQTRRWLECFVRGLNHYIAQVAVLPEEFHLFALGREAWSVADVLRIGRLVSADVNWIVWSQLLKLRREKDWSLMWQRLIHHDVLSPGTVPFSGGMPADIAEAVLRSGSNCFVVSPPRTAAGAPLIASDPHLMSMLPNPWIILGMKSPSYDAVGLAIPGLPFIAAGRNAAIAWGGTSLHAASSDLVITAADDKIWEREEAIAVRWGRTRKFRVRESRWGPIVNDIPWLRSGNDRLALRWIGHQASDEITAMLRANRASNWAEFRAAFDGFAIPGQHMLYADCAGHIGRLMAARLPSRHEHSPPDLTTKPECADHWTRFIGGTELPSTLDTPQGFIASANERLIAGDLVVGHHFSPGDRKRRLDQLLSTDVHVSIDAAARIQRDVFSLTALRQRDVILRWLEEVGFRPRPRERRFIADLRSWDGSYSPESRGALAFELMFCHLAYRLVGRRRREAYSASWGARTLVWHDVQSASPNVRKQALRKALCNAAGPLAKGTTWGDFHRLEPNHPLALVPVIGRAFRSANVPTGGSSETLSKTAHPMTVKRHVSRYGSSARHISDLSDPNRNYFVLLGGQDGWFQSDTFADQIALWQRGEYVVVPLMPDKVAATFPYRTDLIP